MAVTRLLLLGPFYTIQTNFMYYFAHDCMYCNLCQKVDYLISNTHQNLRLYRIWLKNFVLYEVFTLLLQRVQSFVQPNIRLWLNVKNSALVMPYQKRNSSLPCPLRLYMGSIDWIAFFLFQFFEEKSRQFIMVEFTIRSGGGE